MPGRSWSADACSIAGFSSLDGMHSCDYTRVVATHLDCVESGKGALRGNQPRAPADSPMCLSLMSTMKSAVPKGKGGPRKKAKSGGTNTDAEVKELRKLLNSAMKEIADLKLSQSIQERKTAALLRRAGASFVWCLESYRRLRRNAVSRREDCLSEPFFFGLAGCKFRLQVNLYGVGGGAGTHMAFFVQFKVVDLARMDSCCIKKTRVTSC
ncbi:hypothetical protein HPB50_020078 [Hyalomma asiaticum]|uniref:Uncharacterized protein n=1 Tax=Hyalomma asiaticum TaxID=266040 RepID=A0ACB7SAR8_HYAAI|nr:hypothetical protein HPB50_020078 [Hyalomma asiaticum]